MDDMNNVINKIDTVMNDLANNAYHVDIRYKYVAGETTYKLKKMLSFSSSGKLALIVNKEMLSLVNVDDLTNYTVLKSDKMYRTLVEKLIDFWTGIDYE